MSNQSTIILQSITLSGFGSWSSEGSPNGSEPSALRDGSALVVGRFWMLKRGFLNTVWSGSG